MFSAVMIFDAVLLLFGIYAYWMVLRYNLHMFQLNGYKNDEHIRWLSKNKKGQWVLLLPFLTAILVLLFNTLPVKILAVVLLLPVIFVYRFYKKSRNKKVLVFTPRVKRLITTGILLGAILAVGIDTAEFFCGQKIMMAAGVMFSVAALPFLVLLSNVVNSPVEKGVNRHFINDAKRILREKPEMLIIGVTGSYGKTSVKYFLKELLQDRFNVLVTPGNFNTTLGVVRTIRENLKRTDEVFICEMGARRAGDIKEICDLVHPSHGIITSVGLQHLDTFHNIENIKSTKFELADSLPAGGHLFVNGDNEYINQKKQEYSGVIDYHSEGSGGFYAKNIILSTQGTKFTAVTPSGDEMEFSTRLIGSHNIVNIMGAIAVAVTLGIELKDLKIPVRRLESVPHRLQLINHGAYSIIDDAYNSNPVGSKAAVETLGRFDGVRILVTPGMVELGEKEDEYNEQFGKYAAGNCDYILLIGEKHTAPIKRGVLAAGFDADRCRVFEKLGEAMNYAFSINETGHKYILLENDLPDNYN